MNLKSLATGVTTAAGAVVIVGAAAAGVTSVASVTTATSPATQLVVWDIPMPEVPAPDLQGPLVQTLNGVAAGGSMGTYVEGGLGRGESLVARAKYSDAAAKGYFPVTFTVANVDQNGPIATANVTAVTANGITTTRPLTFVAAPSPSGWVIQKAAALSFLSSLG